MRIKIQIRRIRQIRRVRQVRRIRRIHVRIRRIRVLKIAGNKKTRQILDSLHLNKLSDSGNILNNFVDIHFH